MQTTNSTLARLVCGFTVFTLLSAAFLCTAAAQDYLIPSNTPGFIKKAVDLGAMDPSTVISVTVWLNMQNQNKLDQLVQQQYHKGSSSYHNWITQDEFNASFGPTSQEVKSVQNFLTSHRLTVLAVAENNMFIKVQGTVGDIEKAFHVQIDNYNFNGVTYRSNKGNPSVNSVSGAHVAAITGMDDFGFEPGRMSSWRRRPRARTRWRCATAADTRRTWSLPSPFRGRRSSRSGRTRK